jgi:hypothetical protein
VREQVSPHEAVGASDEGSHGFDRAIS